MIRKIVERRPEEPNLGGRAHGKVFLFASFSAYSFISCSAVPNTPVRIFEYMRDEVFIDTSLFSSNKRLRLVFRPNIAVWLKTALNQEYWQIESRSVPVADVAQLHVV